MAAHQPIQYSDWLRSRDHIDIGAVQRGWITCDSDLYRQLGTPLQGPHLYRGVVLPLIIIPLWSPDRFVRPIKVSSPILHSSLANSKSFIPFV